jgi:hypothetical protein
MNLPRRIKGQRAVPSKKTSPQNKATLSTKAQQKFSEQDTADKLILPFLSSSHGFPHPDSLDYQAQHSVPFTESESGRYDGMYLNGGYPYVILEAKRFTHDLTAEDTHQARAYATSGVFDKPVPFLIVSNGREHRFFKRASEINPLDGLLRYEPIPPTDWGTIIAEPPGEVRRLLGEAELVDILLQVKRDTFRDISAQFVNDAGGDYKFDRQPQLGPHLKTIVEERRKFIGKIPGGEQAGIRVAIEAISLHFAIKVLFIKLIEDLSSGSGTPRIIHTLFPRPEYDLIGGLFGFKVLNALSGRNERDALRLYVKSRKFYRRLARDLARVSWQDIFRYGFNIHTARYGKLFRAANYDRFLPAEDTLEHIRQKLIEIDIRSAILYGAAKDRLNVIGKIYERLINDELRDAIGAVYTPDVTMKFMVALGKGALGRFRGHKILEPACGSGHFYRQLYRDYVDDVVEDQKQAGQTPDYPSAHAEALSKTFGRDIDPFAVQLTLLGTFLEQLKDNVRPNGQGEQSDAHDRLWEADKSIDTQNSLDPITIDPALYFDIEKTMDLGRVRSRLASCVRSLHPDLIIGNPPYGVSVVPGAHYSDIYDLGSPDSYGYFIVNALMRLPEGRRMILIVSSSFLTIKTHHALRKYILDNAKIHRVIKLNRNTFPRIDIFPVVLELERCSDPKQRKANVYHFYDLWQLHPERNSEELEKAYETILDDREAASPWPNPKTRSARYTVRQGIIERFSRIPIFEAKASLYEFMYDQFPKPPAESELTTLAGKKLNVRPHSVRERQVVKLSAVAEVRFGLQSGNNSKFYRTASGVKGGAVKGGYHEVNEKLIVKPKQLLKLRAAEKSDGIPVDDPSTDAHFVPLDKAAESDIEGGLLMMFSRPVEFYINWSESAVAEMKELPGAVFRNPGYYFKRGVSFSNTGIYCPTFRLSHGGVFDQKGSCIFSDLFNPEYLVGLLSSTLMKYFTKSFINHGVDAQLDDLPVVLPTEDEIEAMEDRVRDIVKAQSANPGYDYRPDLAKIDDMVFDMYGLTEGERTEVQAWNRRHYPKLFGNTEAES